LLSGGLTNIKNFELYAGGIFEKKCVVSKKGQFLAAIGAALSGG
jgi:activator of 2-hydroxyglutaryl-CoA dehydratase